MIVLNGNGRIADVVALADRRDQVSVSPKSSRPSAVRTSRRPTSARDSPPTAEPPVSGESQHAGFGRRTDYGMRLLRSHAADAGDPLDTRTVRAMLAVRLVQLCVPGAGLDPRILGGLERMLNEDACPSSSITHRSAPGTSRPSPERR